MVTFPLATCARLLGIHPKTLHHWLTAAAFPVAAHPTDARLRCVAEDHLLELAKQHGRPLPALSAVAALERAATTFVADEQAQPLPAHEAEPAHCAAWLSAPAASLLEQFQSEPSELVLQGRDLGVQLGKLLEQVRERSGRSRQRSSAVSGLFLVCRQELCLLVC